MWGGGGRKKGHNIVAIQTRTTSSDVFVLRPLTVAMVLVAVVVEVDCSHLVLQF